MKEKHVNVQETCIYYKAINFKIIRHYMNVTSHNCFSFLKLHISTNFLKLYF